MKKNGEVIPVEIKAGNNFTPSLNRFINDYHPSIAYKFISGNLGLVDNKLTLPHYMVIFL